MSKAFKKASVKLDVKKPANTPGAKYTTDISEREVKCAVKLPFKLELDEEEKAKLEIKIQEALDKVLGKHWKW